MPEAYPEKGVVSFFVNKRQNQITLFLRLTVSDILFAWTHTKYAQKWYSFAINFYSTNKLNVCKCVKATESWVCESVGEYKIVARDKCENDVKEG